jgi:hypothetical protein
MIRNEAEYQEASKRLGDELKRLDEHRARLKEAGLGDAEVKRVIDPLESFHLQLKEEVTLERAAKILDALHVRLRTQVAIEPLPPSPVAQAS